MTHRCLACGARRLSHVIDLGLTPALAGVMWDEPHAARAVARGRLDLWICEACGHVSNAAFDPSIVDYDIDYDNSLHFSPTFQRYADELASRLVATYDLHDRKIVEIGSGKGDFLAEICRLGGNSGTGYDPTYKAGHESPHVRLVGEYFRPGVDHVDDYDLLVCRHVLEHLEDPAQMLASIAAAAPEDAVLYLEVPAAEFNFGPTGMWDCIYPHVSYFSSQSFRRLVERSGLLVLAAGRSFEGQFLWVEARRGSSQMPIQPDVHEHRRRVAHFADVWRGCVDVWRARLAAEPPGSTAIWGAGSKGITFLNAVDRQGLLSVVDVNPRKWGRYLPGTGHEVRDPRTLAGREVSRVIVMNPVYRPEIDAQLASIGVQAETVCV